MTDQRSHPNLRRHYWQGVLHRYARFAAEDICCPRCRPYDLRLIPLSQLAVVSSWISMGARCHVASAFPGLCSSTFS